MSMLRPLTLATLLACLPALGACGSGEPASHGIAADVSATVASALNEAQSKLRSEPITISHNDHGLPRAEIMPSGDFIIGGKTVAVTPAQRAELLDYREQMIVIASEGIAIGKQGAALGTQAASEALSAVFSGASENDVHQRIEAKAQDIRKSAAKICDRLPALMAEQQKLAAALPAFKPYATMTQDDISDCRKDALDDAND